jgi:hypothetical protein
MSEKKTASIVIDDVEYTEDQLSDEQKVSHQSLDGP